MSIRKALIICNGEPPPRGVLKRLAAQAGFIVAADGGAATARKAGVRPDVIIGDLDSLPASARKLFKSTEIIRVARQDSTDFEKALAFLDGKNVKKVDVAAACGMRIDFTLANFLSVWKYVPRFDVSFHGDGWVAVPFTRSIRFSAPPKTTVSLIPFGRCAGITLRGLEYSLTDGAMAIGDTGVSNTVRKPPCSVTVRKGKMLLVVLARKGVRIGRDRW